MEEGENGLTGYELKLSITGARVPRLWEEEYQGGFQLINRSNYLNFLLEGTKHDRFVLRVALIIIQRFLQC